MSSSFSKTLARYAEDIKRTQKSVITIIMVRRTNFNQEIRTSYGSLLAVDLKNRSKPEFSTAKDGISAFNKNIGVNSKERFMVHGFTYCICSSTQCYSSTWNQYPLVT
jgi:hypothetical protein